MRTLNVSRYGALKLTLLLRLTLKPSEKLNSSRQFFIMGPNVDHAKLSTDRAALYDFFVEYSGLAREAFGEIAWVTDYR